MWVWIESIGAIVGLLYLYLEYKASIWLWLVSAIMPAIYIFIYYHGGFYADAGINAWYIIASIYGWIAWRKGRKKEGELLISHTPKDKIPHLIIATIVFFVIIYYVLVTFTDSTVPYGDSITTAMSVVALWMLARKYVEQWLVWLVINLISVGLYLHKGLYPTGILYSIYSVAAVFGYIKWLKMMKNQNYNK